MSKFSLSRNMIKSPQKKINPQVQNQRTKSPEKGSWRSNTSTWNEK